MRDAFGRYPNRPIAGLLTMAVMVWTSLTMAACGGADAPMLDAALDPLAMAGADEWLEHDSMEGGAPNGPPERLNQGGV